MLHVLQEEVIPEEGLDAYARDVYRVTCVSECLATPREPGRLVRTTYLVDWEQLVHLLEGYDDFPQDIVEVVRITSTEADAWRLGLARA